VWLTAAHYIAIGFEIHADCCDVCILVNKRLDDWISVDFMDLSKLEPPKKENKTPMKVMNGSRPSSPDREMVRGTYTALLS